HQISKYFGLVLFNSRCRVVIQEPGIVIAKPRRLGHVLRVFSPRAVSESTRIQRCPSLVFRSKSIVRKVDHMEKLMVDDISLIELMSTPPRYVNINIVYEVIRDNGPTKPCAKQLLT